MTSVLTTRHAAPTAADRPALRIALLCETDAIGGAETMLFHLAEGLRARGHSVQLVLPAGGNGPLGTRFRDAGFATHGFTLRRAIDPACVRSLAAYFTEQRIDVAHSHMFTMGVYGTAAARRAGIGHAITMHGTGRETAVLRRRIALRWAFRRSDAAVAVSQALRAELRALLGPVADRARVIPNGIPALAGDAARVRAELALRADELLVLAVGNMYHNKAHRLLLEALSRLPAELPWRVAIAGREEEATPELRAFVAAQRWEGRAHILGPRHDVADLLAAADVWTMPSLREALPMSLLEAMICGTPVVASRVGGIPEAVRDGVEGLLVPPGDVDALADALRRLLTDAELRRRVGEAGRARAAADFGLDAMTAAHELMYYEAARRTRRLPAR